MKMKNVMVAALVLVTSVAFAGAPYSKFAVVAAKESSVFKVIYEGVEAGNVSLTIYNEDGSVVYSETLKGVEKFIRPVNFGSMIAGDYKIEISDANGKQAQNISVGKEVKKASSLKGVHVAKVINTDKYLLSVANNGAEQISVRILDAANNVIFTETVTASADFAKVYNLKEVNGNPTFEISSNGVVTTIVK
jgi:hypothetical protein